MAFILGISFIFFVVAGTIGILYISFLGGKIAYKIIDTNAELSLTKTLSASAIALLILYELCTKLIPFVMYAFFHGNGETYILGQVFCLIVNLFTISALAKLQGGNRSIPKILSPKLQK